MNIISTQYSISTQSLDVYFCGCNAPHCKGCHNSEIWEFEDSDNIKEKLIDIEEKIKDFDLMIKNIFILGGEPLDQDIEKLTGFLNLLSQHHKPVWLFTRYSLSQVPDEIKRLCAYIKCGRFEIDNMSDDNIQYDIKIASRNQKIYKKGKDYNGEM